MKKRKKIFRGISIKFDALFFRNLTIIIAAVLIWRGMWNFIDLYFFPNNFILSNTLSIILGIMLVYIFDTEVEDIK